MRFLLDVCAASRSLEVMLLKRDYDALVRSRSLASFCRDEVSEED